MLEQMLKEYIIKLIREDKDVRDELSLIGSNRYDVSALSTIASIAYVVRNDESVQDTLREYVRDNIWEEVEAYVDFKIKNAINKLTIVGE